MPDSLVTIPWDDGSGDSIYLNFSTVVETGQATVTSDFNYTGYERSKVLSFRTTTNGLSNGEQAVAYLTVIQKTDGLVVAQFEDTVSIYDETKAGYGNSLETASLLQEEIATNSIATASLQQEETPTTAKKTTRKKSTKTK